MGRPGDGEAGFRCKTVRMNGGSRGGYFTSNIFKALAASMLPKPAASFR